MNRAPAIVDRETGEIVVFDPTKTADHLLGLDAVKARAARMKDWPTMELAIAEQVDLQRDHVAWWRGNVTPNRGSRTDINPGRRRSLTLQEAEHITGISQQQTSKWAAKVLSDEAQARERQAATLKQNTVPERIPERIPERSVEAREVAAEKVGVNPRYVSDAKKIAREAPQVIGHGSDELIAAVESGTIRGQRH